MATLTLNLTNLTSVPSSPITASEGDALTITLTPNASYHLPLEVSFSNNITTKTYNNTTGVITLTMPSTDASITASASHSIEKALIGKATYIAQTNDIINAILNTPINQPARYTIFTEVVGNKIVIHNHGGSQPIQELTLEGLPAPSVGNTFLHAKSDLTLEWATNSGGTTVTANPTITGTPSYLTSLGIDSAKYKIPVITVNPSTISGTIVHGKNFELMGQVYDFGVNLDSSHNQSFSNDIKIFIPSDGNDRGHVSFSVTDNPSVSLIKNKQSSYSDYRRLAVFADKLELGSKDSTTGTAYTKAITIPLQDGEMGVFKIIGVNGDSGTLNATQLAIIKASRYNYITRNLGSSQYELFKLTSDKSHRGYTYVDKDGTKYIDIDLTTGEWELTTISNLVNITYSNLKTLRDNSKLIVGQKYRITDYQCSTAQSDTTQAAMNVFDIIVTALANNKLDENASAIWHSGDTYFTNSKLTAWELKYCLDNDTTRFAWASSSGKGVIFYMKDEWFNECYYDFKNIQFTRDGSWYYTFDVNGQDYSVVQSSKKCYGNKIGLYTGGLNKIVFKNNSMSANCYSNTFENNCYSNTFENNCSSNTFGDDCYSNTFENNCSYNTFGDGYNSNTFGNNCHSNTFGNNCYSNTFGDGYNSNTFGNNCSSNTFGNNCYSNTFENNCYSNTFGNNCHSNTFGNNCHSNTFGNNCSSNTFENNCSYNTFGDDCKYNTFGNSCYSNKLVDSSSSYPNKAFYNIFENGVNNVKLYSNGTLMPIDFLQNITIRQGVNNKTITETRGATADITYRATGYQDKTV